VTVLRSSSSAKATKRGLADHVYEEIKGMLFESRFGRGGWLPVDELAGELSVSRQPVMDAMKRLAIEGFVDVVPQVGCKVREYSSEEIHEFFILFADCEAIVARLAAERATADDITHLKIVSGQIEQLTTVKLSKYDLARLYRSLNRTLHTEIRRMARSAPVTEIVESLGDRSDFFIATSGRPMFAETLATTLAEHAAIVSAIARHNPVAAHEAMQKHVLGTDARLQTFLHEDAALAARRSAREGKRAKA